MRGHFRRGMRGAASARWSPYLAYLQVVGELRPAGVPRVHGDEGTAGVHDVQLRAFEHKPLETSRFRLLNA